MKNPFSGRAKRPPKAKPKGIPVNKVEVVDGKVKFFVAKGMGKKRWVNIKEIAVDDIDNIEATGNELTITSKSGIDSFFMKENPNFSKVSEEVNGILAGRRQSKETVDKAALRRSELLDVINASIGWVDVSFDVLIGLQEKHVDWQRLEGYAGNFAVPFDFKAQTLPPLNLDFSGIIVASKKQASQDTSKEAYSILKTVYSYFDGLSPDGEVVDSKPSLKEAKALILAYYLLNDLLLGRVVGDKENKRETVEFEGVLQKLADVTNFKVNAGELLGSVDGVGVEGNVASVVVESRGVFMAHVKDL